MVPPAAGTRFARRRRLPFLSSWVVALALVRLSVYFFVVVAVFVFCFSACPVLPFLFSWVVALALVRLSVYFFVVAVYSLTAVRL